MKDRTTTWFRAVIPFRPEAADAVGHHCLRLGASGLQEFADRIEAYYGRFSAGTEAGDAAAEASQIQRELERALEPVRQIFGPHSLGPLTVVPVPPQDWLEGWRKTFRPLAVGRRLLVIPAWMRREVDVPPGRIPLWIDPGVGFGTGEHASTRLALILLESVLHEERARRKGPDFGPPSHQGPLRIADLGTGSGILAIAAARYAPAEVWAVDTDRHAIEAARRNAAANGVAGRIHWLVGDVRDPVLTPDYGGCEVVVANLYAPLLYEAAAAISAWVRPGGRLILSGFTSKHRETLCSRYGDGWTRMESVTMQGWTGLSLRREV